MGRSWTFGRKVGAGFAVSVALTIVIGFVGVTVLESVIADGEQLLTVDAPKLVDAERLATASAQKGAAGRGYLLTGEDRFLADLRDARDDFATILDRLRRAVGTDEGRSLVAAIERAEAEHQTAYEPLLAARRAAPGEFTVTAAFEEQLVPRRVRLDREVEAFVRHEQGLLDARRRAAADLATTGVRLVIAIALLAAAAAVGAAIWLTRSLGQQIGSAVGQVQSSSAELHAAATQQATGAREQTTAMTEITTTIGELLASSRQIADSSQRVAHIAAETAGSARTGESTVERAHEAIGAIRKQVDVVVGHMLELGKKSQQIGAVVDIVTELAEQTNILAINATIEAAGAGEGGRRFAVVADEIRKLADRVALSAKEIRGLVEDVRGSVNATVMATESGSKAVDAGARTYGEVTSSFRQIASLVGTTTEAAREIELSTKQQSSAVEQVNVAIANVAQASREGETSSTQTLQTASQLSGLSRDLLQLVQPRAAA